MARGEKTKTRKLKHTKEELRKARPTVLKSLRKGGGISLYVFPRKIKKKS